MIPKNGKDDGIRKEFQQWKMQANLLKQKAILKPDEWLYKEDSIQIQFSLHKMS